MRGFKPTTHFEDLNPLPIARFAESQSMRQRRTSLILIEILKDKKVKIIPKIICVTAFEDSYTRDNLLKCGFYRVFQKDIFKEDVIEGILKEYIISN